MRYFTKFLMFLIVFIFFSFPGFCTELKHWPAKEAKILENLIKKNAHKGEYAVFDADNTIWFRDLEESLLPYLENKDLLTRRTLDPSLKLIPFHAEDTLVSYAYKLYDIDHKIGYPWIAQVFCGFTLGELKVHVDNLFALNGKAMPCKYWSEGKLTEYYPETPTIYPGQIELINKLNENGIEVYVVTAAHEELVRMVVSDPKYKINVKPENVIGVTTLLKDRETNEVTTARLQIEKGHFFDEEYTKEDHYKKEMTPYIWSPNTMYVGKMAAIKDYIHPVKKPILVAGDAPSDHWMLFESDYSKGGVKVWVNRKEKYWKKTQEAMAERAELEKEAGLKPSADKNWIMVHPKDIGIK